MTLLETHFPKQTLLVGSCALRSFTSGRVAVWSGEASIQNCILLEKAGWYLDHPGCVGGSKEHPRWSPDRTRGLSRVHAYSHLHGRSKLGAPVILVG